MEGEQRSAALAILVMASGGVLLLVLNSSGLRVKQACKRFLPI